MKTHARTIDDYIGGFPPDVRAILEQIRQTIREAAPDAEETIKYKMPTFTLKGNLVYFAAYKKHIGMYPSPSTGTDEFRQMLAVYQGPKGAIRFPLDRPIPYDLISQIVKFRVRDNLDKSAATAKKR